MLTRRGFSIAGVAAGVTVFGFSRLAHSQATKGAPAYAVTHSDDEWRKLLTPEQYDVLRQKGTERAFTSPLLNEHRAGIFGLRRL